MVLWRAGWKRRACRRVILAAAASTAATAVLYGLLGASQQGQAAAAQATSVQTPPVPQWQVTAGGKKEFEVASVRLSPPDASTRGTDFLSPFEVAPPKGGFLSANAVLLNYIVFAYKILDTSQYPSLMAQLPKWARTDQFDIEARAEGSPTTDQMRLMMQSLLLDRFKLAIHSETRQIPVYALVLDKPGKLGPQLRPHPAGAACANRGDTPVPVAAGSTPPPFCGMDSWLVEGRIHDRMVDVTMEQVVSLVGGSAGFVGGREHLPVLDQTGLTGKYDLDIEFVKDPGGPDIDSNAWGQTFTGALRNQLGLKLVKQTGPVSVIVIDHVEMPSEN